MQPSPLQRERRRRGFTQAQVADELRGLAWQLGHGELGIDANAVSRHERGIIGRPRDPLPDLYARLYGVAVEQLWPPARMKGMDRRGFLQAAAAAGAGALLPDDDLASLQQVTSGFRRLEATTPARELQGPVLAHLRLVAGRINHGPGYAMAAAELARFAAWLAWDQLDHPQARTLYQRAVGYAERAHQDQPVAHMLGSWALWCAETGQGPEAVRVARRMPAGQGPWLQTMHATVAASVGDADHALASLRQAERQLTAAGIGLTPAALAGYVGRTHLLLRLPKTAAPALREALAADPPARHRALLLAGLARVVDADEAAVLRGKARTLGRQLGSRRILAEVAG
jgi:hypothetical protein